MLLSQFSHPDHRFLSYLDYHFNVSGKKKGKIEISGVKTYLHLYARVQVLLVIRAASHITEAGTT
jgi:hypothetical protein